MTLYIDDVRQALHALEQSGTPLGSRTSARHHAPRPARRLLPAHRRGRPGAQDA
ncbi:MAG: hypothetical protein U1E57_08080 [Paenacidovorax caeni]